MIALAWNTINVAACAGLEHNHDAACADLASWSGHQRHDQRPRTRRRDEPPRLESLLVAGAAVCISPSESAAAASDGGGGKHTLTWNKIMLLHHWADLRRMLLHGCADLTHMLLHALA